MIHDFIRFFFFILVNNRNEAKFIIKHKISGIPGIGTILTNLDGSICNRRGTPLPIVDIKANGFNHPALNQIAQNITASYRSQLVRIAKQHNSGGWTAQNSVDCISE